MAGEYLYQVLLDGTVMASRMSTNWATLVPTNIRYRDGSYSNSTTPTDRYAGFNEIFPLFNWYVVESDSTRFKNTEYCGLRRRRTLRRFNVRGTTGTVCGTPSSAEIWRTLRNRFLCPLTCGCLEQGIAQWRLYCYRREWLTGALIRLGLPVRVGKASPARTPSLNLARSPSRWARPADPRRSHLRLDAAIRRS